MTASSGRLCAGRRLLPRGRRVSVRPQVESLTRGPRCNPLSLLVAHLARRLR